jgi:hypothetical protein
MLKNSRMFVYPVVMLAVFACLASFTMAQKLPVPRGWKRVTACQFSFLLPESMRDTTTRGIDSCLAGYEGDGISVRLDFGVYNGPISKQDSMKNYRKSVLSINGRKARLITYEGANYAYPKATEIRIVTAGPKYGFRSTSLSMSICTKPPFDAEIVKRIYQSIKYLGK